jgi:hypothetical protein
MSSLKKSRLPRNKYWTPLRIVREFHRADDDFVAFARVLFSGDFQHLFSRRSDTIGPMIAHIMRNDGRFTPNGFWRHNSSDAPKRPWGAVARKQWDLRYLCACWVDIDFDERKWTFESVKQLVLKMAKREQLPPPSMLMDSGRHLWVFWLIHSKSDPSKPERGDPQKYRYNFRLWQRVQLALADRLHFMGADLAARDGSRCVRFPESTNPNAKRRVRFHVLYGRPSERISYRLEQIAKLLGVPLVVLKPKSTKKKSLVSDAKKLQPRAMLKNRLDQFYHLERIRGGIHLGSRDHAALILATCLKGLGLRTSLIEEELIAFGARCKPLLDRGTCKRKVNAADPTKWMKNTTIADNLKITADEASQLDTWPAAGSENRPKKRHGPTKMDLREQRLRLCRRSVTQNRNISCRDLVRLYRREGQPASAATAARDLRAVRG